MKIEVQRENQIEKEKTGDADTQKCEKETVNRLECGLSRSVVIFQNRKKLLRRQVEAYGTKRYGEATLVL